MKTYAFSATLGDKFFPQTFEGEQQAANTAQAVREIKEWYACEFGTDESNIQVKITKEL